MQRDTQRNRIARAEDDFNQTLPPTLGREAVWQLQTLASAITGRAWWRKTLLPPHYGIEVAEGYSGKDCMPSINPRTRGYVIQLAPMRQTRVHLLHGMAHVLLDTLHQGHLNSNTPHDPEFVKVYLELVRRFQSGMSIDDEAKRQFKSFLRAEGVKTKSVSEATREKQRSAMLIRMTPTMESSLQLLKDLEDM